MKRYGLLFAGMLAAMLLGAAGYAGYRMQARRAAALSRITLLATRLAASNQQRAQEANKTILGINEGVRKNNSTPADIAVLWQVQCIQARTRTLLDTLHQLQRRAQTASIRARLGQLPVQVNHYAAFIQNLTPELPASIRVVALTATASYLREFNASTELKPTTFALLTKLETQIRQLEAAALMNQARKVGARDYFDKIGAFAVPASETITPGAIYRAQLVLALSTPNASRQFSANGREVPVSPATGQGLVRFRVPAASPSQPDTLRAQWHGRVQMHWGVADTILNVTVPYLILKSPLR